MDFDAAKGVIDETLEPLGDSLRHRVNGDRLAD